MELPAGFVVLTGETGAGKSLIIQALGLLCGDRAKPDAIREGADEAAVEGVFTDPDARWLTAKLQALDLPEAEELLVRRVVRRNGRNRIYINGTLATLNQLQELMQPLMSIYGQHQQQQLLRPQLHIALLDAFAGLEPQVTAYQQALQQWRQLQQQQRQWQASQQQRQERLELLRFQDQELTQAALASGEDEELAAEQQRLQHAQELYAVAQEGHELLYAGEQAICGQLAALQQRLGGLLQVDSSLQGWQDVLSSAQYNLEDLAQQMVAYAQDVVFDEQRFQEVEERLQLLQKLKRKYGASVDDILAAHEQIRQELAQLEQGAQTQEDLQQQVAAAADEVQRLGQELGQARRQAAPRLCQQVMQQLQALAMPQARLEIAWTPLDEPRDCGLEEGQLWFGANPGEPLQPLAEVASGGELSRIMLALRCAAPQDQGGTQIFDEVDAGVGGEAATAVGERLARVAGKGQVLCVTHLPQVAAFADHHLQVAKATSSGRTQTELRRLQSEEQVQELARMLGGAHITHQTLAHARELLQQSRCQ